MKIMKFNKSGFTLIEIIVSMALIGFIAVSFLTLFTSGFTNIFMMGKKTQVMNYDAQMYMDKIYDNVYTLSTSALNITDDVTAIIVSENYNSTGLRLVELTVEYPNNRSVKLRGLIP